MFKRLIASLICITFSFSNLQYAHAQDFSINQLPVPGKMISVTPTFMPLTLKGMVIHPENALKFDFLMDTGHSNLKGNDLSDEALKIMKYFLTALTIPEDDLWVNLSPYEKGRIVQDNFGQTIMGRDLLAEDYVLKQLTASVIYPENSLGKEFWSEIYAKAGQQLGSTQIPVNTFNKVWIVPDQAVVWEHEGNVIIVKSHLKVMLEADYLSASKHLIPGLNNNKEISAADAMARDTVRKLVIPVLEKEVNIGKNFAQLRQMFQAMILATWYKKALRESILTKVYADQKKTKGVDGINAGDVESIYQQYLKAFKKGAFNYIKEDLVPATGQSVPRKYFSGGFSLRNGLVTLATALLIWGATLTNVQAMDVNHALESTGTTILVKGNITDVGPGASAAVVKQFEQPQQIHGQNKDAAMTVVEMQANEIARQVVSMTGRNPGAFLSAIRNEEDFQSLEKKEPMVAQKIQDALPASTAGYWYKSNRETLIAALVDPVIIEHMDQKSKKTAEEQGSFKEEQFTNENMSVVKSDIESLEDGIVKKLENIKDFLLQDSSFPDSPISNGYVHLKTKGTVRPDLIKDAKFDRIWARLTTPKTLEALWKQFAIDFPMIAEKATGGTAITKLKQLLETENLRSALLLPNRFDSNAEVKIVKQGLPEGRPLDAVGARILLKAMYPELTPQNLKTPLRYKFSEWVFRASKGILRIVKLFPRSGKRPSQYEGTGIFQPFNPNKGFNYNKINEKEEIIDETSIDDIPVSVVVNTNPFAESHHLLTPYRKESLPQYLNRHEFIKIALKQLLRSQRSNYKVAFNSLGAFGSINHLHFQDIYYEGDEPENSKFGGKLPVENANTDELFTTPDGVKVSTLHQTPSPETSGYPVNGVVFSSVDGNVENLAKAAFSYVDILNKREIAYNILFTKKSATEVGKVIVMPRQPQRSNPFGAGTAFLEMSGEFIVFDTNTTNHATQEPRLAAQALKDAGYEIPRINDEILPWLKGRGYLKETVQGVFNVSDALKTSVTEVPNSVVKKAFSDQFGNQAEQILNILQQSRGLWAELADTTISKEVFQGTLPTELTIENAVNANTKSVTYKDAFPETETATNEAIDKIKQSVAVENLTGKTDLEIYDVLHKLPKGSLRETFERNGGLLGPLWEELNKQDRQLNGNTGVYFEQFFIDYIVNHNRQEVLDLFNNIDQQGDRELKTAVANIMHDWKVMKLVAQKNDLAMSHQPMKDKAVLTKVPDHLGGIALNAKLLDLQIKRDGNGVPLPSSQQPLDKINIQGFVPQIISIQPVDLQAFIGFNFQKEEALAKV